MHLFPGCRVGIVQAFNLGDVIACLPMAAIIKREMPTAQVIFIGRCYARAVALACENIDEFVDAEHVLRDPQVLAAARIDILLNPFPHRELAQSAYQARIPIRIGNLRRGMYARWCNRFVFYGRRKTGLHEAQLNLRDLSALGLREKPGLQELQHANRLSRLERLDAGHRELLDRDGFNLLLHTKSNGNGREWPLQHYLALVRSLPAERFRIFLTGSADEGNQVQQQCPALLQFPGVVPVFGRFSLPQFMAFIAAADGMVAAGTGPIHLAAALGIHALGIFPSREGINTQRWQPIGPKAETLQFAARCPRPPASCGGPRGCACFCTQSIEPERVRDRVMNWFAQRQA